MRKGKESVYVTDRLNFFPFSYFSIRQAASERIRDPRACFERTSIESLGYTSSDLSGKAQISLARISY